MKRFLCFAAAISLIGCSTSSKQHKAGDTQPPGQESSVTNGPGPADVPPSESEELTSTKDHVYVTMSDAGLRCGKSKTEQSSADLDACIVADTEIVELLVDANDAWERVVESIAKIAPKVERVEVTDNLDRTTMLGTTTPSDLEEHIVIHYDDRGVKAACLTADEPGFYPADLPAVNVETPIIAEALDGVPCDNAEWIGVYCEGTLETDGCMRVLEAATEAYPQPIVLIDSNPS